MAFSAEENNQLTGEYIRMCPEDESFDHRFIMTRNDDKNLTSINLFQLMFVHLRAILTLIVFILAVL